MLKLSFNPNKIDIMYIVCQHSIRKSWSILNFLIPGKSSIPWIDIRYSVTLKQKENLPKYFTMKLTTKLTTYKSDIVLTVFKKWVSQKANGLKFEHL